MSLKQIYKITYPNGKIYVGKDLTGDISYFGSPNRMLIEKDFKEDERKNIVIRKEILWESLNSEDKEVNIKEVEYIKLLKSNNTNIGYNQWPRFKEKENV